MEYSARVKNPNSMQVGRNWRYMRTHLPSRTDFPKGIPPDMAETCVPSWSDRHNQK